MVIGVLSSVPQAVRSAVRAAKRRRLRIRVGLGPNLRIVDWDLGLWIWDLRFGILVSCAGKSGLDWAGFHMRWYQESLDFLSLFLR